MNGKQNQRGAKRSEVPPFWSQANPKRAGLFWIFSLLIIAGALFSSSFAYAARYSDRIFPGIAVGEVPVGGLTTEEALELVTKRIDELMNSPIEFDAPHLQGTISLRPLAPEDPDLTRELIYFDRQGAVESAFRIGRGAGVFKNALEAPRVRFEGRVIPLNVTISTSELVQAVRDRLGKEIVPHRDAQLTVTFDETTDAPVVEIVPEISGFTLNEEKLSADLTRSLSRLVKPRLVIALTIDPPTIKKEDATSLLPRARELLAQAPITLTYQKKSWVITPALLAGMLSLERSEDGVEITLAGPTLENLWTEIEKEINRPPQNAGLKIENNKVTSFIPAADGLSLDREANQALILELLKNGSQEGELTVKTEPPEITVRDANALGIEEILGIGISNFRGSPGNRIKNIKNGARLLDGTLIKPGEEFSLLEALRPFTPENGYLPELVIKGDKIIPEIGGGLCQIGTTTFRAAMNSGMPITQRRNHSLVVRYYNDLANGNPGTDATIYDPQPDFRFINDTGAYMLLTTEVDLKASELRFNFWGRPDGRHGSYSAPIVKHWIAPGEPVTTETADLTLGEKKCQEKHVGAEASFTYTVLRPDGTTQETVYESRYRPIPEICLVGTRQETGVGN